jgi:hypothetical protein
MLKRSERQCIVDTRITLAPTTQYTYHDKNFWLSRATLYNSAHAVRILWLSTR